MGIAGNIGGILQASGDGGDGGGAGGNKPFVSNVSPYFAVVNESVTFTVAARFVVDGAEVQAYNRTSGEYTSLPTTFVSDRELTATWTPTDATPIWDLVIENPDGQRSTAYGVPVYTGPPPTTTSATPATAPTNTPVVMTVIGAGFIPASQVAIGSFEVTTTFVSATELTATFTTGPTTVGTSVMVSNPPDGGSNEVRPFFNVVA